MSREFEVVQRETLAGSRPEPLGERVRRIRLERGLSLRQVASAGVSVTHLSRIENENRTPSIQVIRALARRLGVSPEYLETGVELSTREQLELELADAELAIRLDPEDRELGDSLQALIERAKRHAFVDLAARAHAALGTAAAGWGRLAEAVTHLERALRHPVMQPEVVPDAYVSLANAYRQLGRAADAVALLESALERTYLGNHSVRAVFVTHLSHALSDLGDYERAEEVLAEVAADPDDTDPYARARMHWSQARVAAMQDDRRLALRHMSAAIRLLTESEDTERLARAHFVCAEIILWSGKVTGVANHLRTARALVPAHASAETRGILLGLEAMLSARLGKNAEALSAAAESTELLGEEAAEQVRPLYAMAVVHAAEGRFDLADEYFDQVLQIKVQHRLWRDASLIAAERAGAKASAGDAAGSAVWVAQAQELAERASSGALQPASA